MRVLRPLLRVIFWAFVLSIPLLGVWVASSLAALLNGPKWATTLGGALLFPVLPVLWDLWASARGRRREARRKASESFVDALSSSSEPLRLGMGDRLLLRTLSLNLLFLVGLVSWSPRTATTALTARGDWALDGIEGAWVATARTLTLRVADGLDGLAKIRDPDPYAGLEESPTPPPPPPQPPEPPVPPPADPSPVIEAAPEVASSTATSTTPASLTEAEPVEGAATTDPRDAAVVQAPVEATPAGTPAPEPPVLEAPQRGELRFSERFYSGVQGSAGAFAATLREQKRLPKGGSVAADPRIRGKMHLLGPVIVPPAQIAGREVRPPFLRVQLDPAGSLALCEATKASKGQLLFLDRGAVRGLRDGHERICDGVVSFPLEAGLDQGTEGEASGPMLAAEGDGAPAQRPLVDATRLSPSDEGSIASLGAYLQAQFPDPKQRLRAAHDYVATRVTYDYDSLVEGERAAQDADTVFRRRKGVCAGYANLMVAIGKTSALEIVYLTGLARDERGEINGSAHAWNAARIGDRWTLIDATWDAGTLDHRAEGGLFRTDYFGTAPEIFSLTHLPAVEGWQLLPNPITRGEFTRRPLLEPAFFAAGLTLRSPDRSQVDVGDSVELQIDNPRQRQLLVRVRAGAEDQECVVTGTTDTRARCDLPRAGAYEVHLFEAPDGADGDAGAPIFAGRLFVNARGSEG